MENPRLGEAERTFVGSGSEGGTLTVHLKNAPMSNKGSTDLDPVVTGVMGPLGAPTAQAYPPVDQESWQMLQPLVRRSPLRITYATSYDPHDVLAWSGTVKHIGQALEMAGMDVDYLGNLARRHLFMNKAINKITKTAAIGELFPSERTMRMAGLFADRVRENVKRGYSDIVFSPGSIPIALLKTKRRKVFYTDATFASILDMYPEWAGYPKRYVEQGHTLEKLALENCDLALYSSRWAADSAIEHYGVDPDKVRVVPFGSNLQEVPLRTEVENSIEARDQKTCELLFIGVAWERKGGPKVLELARQLNEQGIPTRLHLVGSSPKGQVLPSYVVRHGFISKETAAGRARLMGLLSRSHFLLLPSMAECYGIVLCEANAFGVPSLANRVGGIPEIVKDGINGQLFDVDAPVSDWVAEVARWSGDPTAYKRLAMSSRAEYEKRLNWAVAGASIRQHLEGLY